MKLFWKFFFSIMIVIQSSFSLAGYVLIQYNFQNALNREIDDVYHENDTAYYLSYENLYKLYSMGIDDTDTTYLHEQLFMLLSYQTLKNQIPFSISNENNKIFENNIKIDDQNNLKKTLKTNQRGYYLLKKGKHHYIYCTRKIKFNEHIYYVDNARCVNQLFEERYEQYQVFSIIMVIVFIISSVVIMFLSWWLLTPIKKLSLATKQLTNQVYDVDLPVNSQDEIGLLSKDFLRMSHQIKENITQLKEYNQRQELFIANFTHELKTPLTSIIGYGDMLRSKRMSEEDMILSANHIVSEGKRLEAISKKLMDLLVLKKNDFTFHEISSKIFFEDIKDIMQSMILQNHIEVNFDIEEGNLYIEQDLMKNVVLNIIDNAKNACDDKGKINIIGYKKEKQYVIKIQDNGQGMEQKDIGRVMEAFYMVDKSRTRKHGGAGLGLAIVKEIVDLHQGKVMFDSQLGLGTTVVIILKEKENED